MFCANCGAEIPDGTLVCPKCGVPINSINQTSVSVSEVKAPKSVGGFVCGLLGFILDCFPVLGLVLSIVGVALCSSGRKIVSKNPMAYTGTGLLTAGLVLGIIGIVVGSIVSVATLVWGILLGNGGFFSIMEAIINLSNL